MWVCESTSASYYKWSNNKGNNNKSNNNEKAYVFRREFLACVTKTSRRTSGLAMFLWSGFALSISQVLCFYITSLVRFSFPSRSLSRSFQGWILSGSCTMKKYESSLKQFSLQKTQGSLWLGILYHAPCCKPITCAGVCNVLIDIGLGYWAHLDPVGWGWGATKKG